LLAQRIPQGVSSRAELINSLLVHIVVEDALPKQVITDGPLDGQSFLFTGTLTQLTRADAQARVKSLGGMAASGVSKKLSFLVVGDAGKAGSKLVKAEKLGITILSESEFIERIESQ
jgi:DNA ligase (NAD+)